MFCQREGGSQSIPRVSADTRSRPPSSLFSMGRLCSVKASVGLKVFPVCLLTLARDIHRQTLFSMGGLCSVKGRVGLKNMHKGILTLAVDPRRHFSPLNPRVSLLLVNVPTANSCAKKLFRSDIHIHIFFYPTIL